MVEGNIPVELSAEEWNRYLPLQQKATDIFVKMCAEEWRELKEENAPLRAVINGRYMTDILSRKLQKHRRNFMRRE